MREKTEMQLLKTRFSKRSLVLGTILVLATVTVAAFVGFQHSRSAQWSGTPGRTVKMFSSPRHGSGEQGHVVPRTASHPDKKGAEIAQLKREQLELSRKLKRLEDNVREIQSDSILQDPGEDTQVPLDDETLHKTQEAEDERMRAQTQAQLDLLNNALAGEPRDPQWSVEATQSIQDRVHQYKELGLDLLHVECGSTICRLDIAVPHGEFQDKEKMYHHFAELVPWNSEGFFHIEDAEATEVNIYVARENHSLPRIPNLRN